MRPLGTSGRYREIAIIGQGGMATVKLAALAGPLGIQKLLVIKEALPHLAAEPEFISMFVDEARLASRFDHPNLIQTYEVGETDGRYFIVMEYLDGQPLSALLSRLSREVPVPVLLRVLTRVLAGLHYAHELSDLHDKPLHVVHRDVSPQNVFLCYGGAVKLADFGIAKVADAAVKTQAGTFKGKLAYASPEQVAGDVVDRRSDIFSVGVMLWEGLARKKITHGFADVAILQRRLAGSEPRIAAECPEVPADLAAICDKAMALHREDRYPTAAAMQQALEAHMASAGMTITDVEVGQLVAQTFEDERTSVRKMVQERLAASTADPALAATPLTLHEPSSPSNTSSQVKSLGASATSVETLAAPSLLAAPPRPRPTRLVWVVGGVACACTLALAVASRTTTPPPTAPAVAAAPPPAPPPAIADVDIYLSVEPSSAQLAVDGEPLPSNPYSGRRPLDTKPHTLSASAAGFTPEQRTISFERDVHVELALRAVAPPPPPSASGPAARAAAAPPSRDTSPGGLRFQPKKGRAIDSEDPYGAGK